MMDLEKIVRFAQSLGNSEESMDCLYPYLLGCFGMEHPPDRSFQRRGVLITFDGHSGAGKDTQIRMLSASMRQDSLYSGSNITELVLKKKDPFRQVSKFLWSNPQLLAEGDCSFLLLSAGRKYVVCSAVLPLLEDCRTVLLQNRSYLSHLAYCAAGVGELGSLLAVTGYDVTADLPFILECDVAVAYERVMRRSPEKGCIIYPNERPAYMEKVKKNFQHLYSITDGVLPIETSGAVGDIAAKIKSCVDDYFMKRVGR
jgi:thymidylate kinase